MSTPSTELPADLAAAHAMILAERARHAAELARLEAILKALRRAHFGRRSEKLDPDQLGLALEDVEAAAAVEEAQAEEQDGALKAARAKARSDRRRPRTLPKHLPRIEEVIEPESTACPCCGKEMHQIGEDRAERLDVTPAQFRVRVTRRPKYACRACEEGVVQAPAPAHLIEGGLPTEALIAYVLVCKYADHLPLYRQHQILERQGVEIDRSCLSEWVGRAAFLLKPVTERLLEQLKASGKLFCDETRAPVLDPGRGRTKTGYLWAIARDDRPWGGADPPGVVYLYAPGRGAEHAIAHLEGFSGVLQVDAYAAYAALTDPERNRSAVTLATCWAHLRRKFYEIAEGGNAPIASEALERIAALYRIESDIRGKTADERRAVRQAEARPLVEALFAWLAGRLEVVSKRGALADAIRYGLRHREGFERYLGDGRIEIDSNVVERSIRPLALNRKNALFAGHDQGGVNWGVVASLIETAKLNGVEPNGYLADVLRRLVDGWPKSRIDELLPWAYVKPPTAGVA